MGNEDDKFNPKADLREIKYLLNRDPSKVSSPTTDIDITNPILERFTDEPALKKLLYGDSYNDTHSKNDKTKDSKTKSLIDEANIVESNVLPPQLLTSDSTLPEESSESSEIATLLSSPFRNEDKVFNPEILFHLELTVIETLLSFSSENEDKVFNPGILTLKGVHSLILGLSHWTYETLKIANVHPKILNEVR
ncbi:hypothetical protein Tco_0428959 [Tanacetum coccineum]